MALQRPSKSSRKKSVKEDLKLRTNDRALRPRFSCGPASAVELTAQIDIVQRILAQRQLDAEPHGALHRVPIPEQPGIR